MTSIFYIFIFLCYFYIY